MYFIQSISLEELPQSEYYARIPAIASLGHLSFDAPVTFFMGENGSGKSTLLEAIAVRYGLNAEGGSRDFLFSTRNTHSGLSEQIALHTGLLKPSDTFFLRAESYYNTASYLEELEMLKPGLLNRYYGGNPHQQSHGESFLSLVNHRFRENSFFLMDEPEAALSPQNQLALMVEIDRLAKTRCQFIIATHSPILASMPNSTIYSFDEGKIKKAPLKETGAYQITEMMMNRSESVLHGLFDA